MCCIYFILVIDYLYYIHVIYIIQIIVRHNNDIVEAHCYNSEDELILSLTCIYVYIAAP